MRKGALVAVLVFASSCGWVGASPEPSTPVGRVPAGWQVLTRNVPVQIGDVSKSIPTGFAIALPPGWEEVDPARPVQDMRNLVPSASPVVTPTPGPSSSNVYLIASSSDLSHGQGLSTSIQVSKQHYLGGDLTTDEMTTSMQRYRERTINAHVVLSKHVQLNGLDFAYLQMRHDAQLPGADRETYSSVQYIYVKDREVYIIEFTCLFDRTTELLPLFESIALTFEII